MAKFVQPALSVGQEVMFQQHPDGDPREAVLCKVVRIGNEAITVSPAIYPLEYSGVRHREDPSNEANPDRTRECGIYWVAESTVRMNALEERQERLEGMLKTAISELRKG